MTVFGAVFARGGSKGVPGKNLREISGRSLLRIAIDLGRSMKEIDRVVVSTDSPEIADAALSAGAEVPFLRPPELATDIAPEWLAWQHLARHLLECGASEIDTLVSLPSTAPLRDSEDVLSAIELFEASDFDLVLGVTESRSNPWFNLATRDEVGEVALVAHSLEQQLTRRQDAPQTFGMTTVVYVTSLGFILRSSGLWSGKVGSITVPPERAVDIDSEFDLRLAQSIWMAERKGSRGR